MTKDLKLVEIELHAVARPHSDILVNPLKHTAIDYSDKLLPALNKSMFQIAKSFTLSEILADKKKFYDDIGSHTRKEAEKLGIYLDRIELISLQYPEGFFIKSMTKEFFYHSSKLK